jgi:hypothetical protein
MVENIVVIAIRRAASAKESAIDHVVHEDPGGGQGVILVWLTVLFSSRLRRLALPSQATQAEAALTRLSRSASVRGGEEKALASP